MSNQQWFALGALFGMTLGFILGVWGGYDVAKKLDKKELPGK